MAKAITVEGLSKAYQLGDFGTGTISRDVERFIARIRGKEDPYLRIGETNDRTVKSDSDIVWSLKDLNFDIEEGDAVGIIGRNGAGKSTLLKVLSRITSPTTGSVKVKGRIASLLEVGTGFHPELSGRENIFLNGAILGMRKSDIKRQFDEIVAFAGVERYIDTPVKRYSSGMYVRLAFAVAAHLESEILIVDEVLAVGDAEFQKKCLGKMGDINHEQGRTVLFVSHNLSAIKSLCNKGIVLNNGLLYAEGTVDKCFDKYSALYVERSEKDHFIENFHISGDLNLNHFSFNKKTYTPDEKLEINIDISTGSENTITGFAILIYNNYEVRIGILDLRALELNKLNEYTNAKLSIEVDSLPLIGGTYSIGIFINSKSYSGNLLNLLNIKIEDSAIEPKYPESSLGYINPIFSGKIIHG